MSDKWIFFDCFGVMIDEPYNRWVQSGAITQEQAKALEKEFFDWVDVNAITDEEALQRVTEITHLPAETFFEETWYDKSRVNGELEKWIKANSGKYHIAMLSNSARLYLDPLMERCGIKNLFEKYFISAEMRVAKPSAEIFLRALKECGCAPENAIMVDDCEKNIRAAESIGMHGVIFKNATDAISQIEKMSW